MQEAWLMNEMWKAQNLVQENSRLLINAPHARIAFLPFFALKMVFFPLLCPLTLFSHLLAFLAHSGWTVGHPFFDLGGELFSRYCEQCHNQTNLRASWFQRSCDLHIAGEKRSQKLAQTLCLARCTSCQAASPKCANCQLLVLWPPILVTQSQM